MKQGKLINRIMMLVLLAAVVVYLAASAWRSFRDPYTFVMSYAYTVDDSLEATGFLVREETVLSGGGGTVELLPEEGEKVARGETVALLYQSGEGLERRQELESLTLEREQLHRLGRLLKPYRCIERVELLPFHKLGEYKWEQLGRHYTLGGTREPTAEEMNHARAIFQQYGLPVR